MQTDVTGLGSLDVIHDLSFKFDGFLFNRFPRRMCS